MESIPAASARPKSSFSYGETVTRPGPLRSVTFTSAIGGLRGVLAVSIRAIHHARCIKDGAAREVRPILPAYETISQTYGWAMALTVLR